MANIIIYTKDTCSYCKAAKQFLDARHLKYTEIPVDKDPAKLQEMINISDRRTVPQIIINNKAIGGFDDLTALANSGELDKLLA